MVGSGSSSDSEAPKVRVTTTHSTKTESVPKEEPRPNTWQRVMETPSSWWQTSTATAASWSAMATSATSAAASAAKDATVQAGSATANAAVVARDATVNATVNAAVVAKDATATASASVSSRLGNVVSLAMKAAKESRYKMGGVSDTLTLLHFNDVYNVDAADVEPVGGAARMVTAFKELARTETPIVLFSGDIFAPSTLSTFTKGEQMLPVLDSLGVHCACIGNHDFDFGIEVLMDHMSKTRFPWLISNVTDNETGRPLAEAKVTHIISAAGHKIGLMGLVEEDWLCTLSTVNAEEVSYTDYVSAANMLSRELRSKGCDLVIALTHMRTHNDIRLAENAVGLDLILGGHDHVYELRKVNGIDVLKSGTDFRQFSVITVNFDAESKRPNFDFREVQVTKDIQSDQQLLSALEKYTAKMETELCVELGEFECALDGRFAHIRRGETNLGNFICDIVVAATNADLALLNSGTFRSDLLHPSGPFFLKDLLRILPMIDPLVVLSVSGQKLLECLENGVSKWPQLEGRFPQISGLSFAFDPQKSPGQRVDPRLVRIGDCERLELDRHYRMATKAFLLSGKDGYECLKGATVVADDEQCPRLTYAVQNHFEALAMRQGKTKSVSVHHQSLITKSRRSHLVRQLTDSGQHRLPAHLPEQFRSMDLSQVEPALAKHPTLLELEVTTLDPRVEGRIVVIENEAQREEMLKHLSERASFSHTEDENKHNEDDDDDELV